MAMDRQSWKELLDEEEEIRKNRILAEKDGAIYADFHDASILNSVEAFDPKGTGMKTYNPDGSVASTGKTVHAMNPDFFFLNRYKVKAKKLYVVSGHTPEGYISIRAQQRGVVPYKVIPCHILSRDADGNLVFEKVVTVSDSEFISDFTGTLGRKAMAEILPLIVQSGAEMTSDEMPI